MIEIGPMPDAIGGAVMSEQPAGPVQQHSPFPLDWTPLPPPWWMQRLNEQRPLDMQLRSTDRPAMALWQMWSVIPPQPPLVTVISGC